MKTLPIVWQRLVTEGETCQRCGSTQQNVLQAMSRLDAALRPLGIQPILETREIDDAAFRDDPSQSNRIWIAGKPLEEWLGARVGTSQCCNVCGDLPCRTMELGDSTHEAIPEELIVRAAMMAASGMIGADPTAAKSTACGSSACGCR
jgi:hypothetical protein